MTTPSNPYPIEHPLGLSLREHMARFTFALDQFTALFETEDSPYNMPVHAALSVMRTRLEELLTHVDSEQNFFCVNPYEVLPGMWGVQIALAVARGDGPDGIRLTLRRGEIAVADPIFYPDGARQLAEGLVEAANLAEGKLS